MISVVIPLYNKVRHIKRALDSVLAQTYQDFEVIVVNDGSTDGSEKVVEQYVDPRIQLIHQKNAGVAEARNQGIAKSRTELIAFLDSDDEWRPEHLEIIYRLSVKYPECGAYATAYGIADGKDIVRRPRYNGIPEIPWDGVVENYFKTVEGPFLVSLSSSAVWKHSFLKVGNFPTGVKRGGDGELFFRIAFRYNIGFSNHMGAIWHVDADNRICNNIELDESRVISLLDNFLTRTDITSELPEGVEVSDIVECRNYLLIDASLGLITSGLQIRAREKLSKAYKTTRYRRKWLLVYLSTFIPRPLFIALRYLKRKAGRCFHGVERAISRQQ